MLRVELTLLPDFQYDVKVHGYVQLFHILVEDANGENILYHEMFSLKSSEAEDEHSVVFTVAIMDPLLRHISFALRLIGGCTRSQCFQCRSTH